MRKKFILGAIILLILLLSYNSIVQIMDAVRSGDRLYEAAEKVYQLEAKNRELKKRLSQIKSPSFIEQEGRNKLGLGKSGETVVIIPEDKLKLILGASQSAQETRFPNWLGWWKVFFR